MPHLSSSYARGKEVFPQNEQRCYFVAFVGDGLISDVSFQPLAGTAEQEENLIYICFDNEAYMDTGIQRNGTTPLSGRTTITPIGKGAEGKTQAKESPSYHVFSPHSYVATATAAFPEDFAQKLLEAKAVKDRMAYIYLLVPRPTGHCTG